MKRNLSYDEEVKKKPLRNRIISLFSALMMITCFLDMNSLHIFAETLDSITEESAEEVTEESIPEEETIWEEIIPEKETIPEDLISTELSQSEITSASFYDALTEEEAEEAFCLKLKNNAALFLSQDSGQKFQEADYTKIAEENGLEIFWMKYVTIQPSTDITEGNPEPHADDGTTSQLQHIEVDNNFSIKAKLKIKSNLTVETGRMEIRLPKSLFQNRDSGACEIQSVGVGEFKKQPVKDSKGAYIIDDSTGGIGDNVPFRYYIDGDEYVFVNTAELNSSTTEIEIGYSNVEVFDVRNSTTWKVIPEINVIYDMEKTGKLMADTTTNGDIYTECSLTDSNGTVSKIYRHEIEAINATNYHVYYDEDGNPKYIQDRSNSKWYAINDDYTGGIQNAEILKNSATEITGDAIPVIEPVTIPIQDKQKYATYGIEGKINTEVNFTINKQASQPTTSGYAPQLYSRGQIARYIDMDYAQVAAPEAFKNGKLNTDDYVFVCWDIQTKGNCSQPFSMFFKETPKVLKDDGEFYDVNGALVLGITTTQSTNNTRHKDILYGNGNSDELSQLDNYLTSEQKAQITSDMWYVADTNAEMRSTFGYDRVVDDKKFNNTYYVVTAYPKNEIKRPKDQSNYYNGHS